MINMSCYFGTVSLLYYYAFAKLTEEGEIKASFGVPQISLGNIERLNEDRFARYYCYKCRKEYTGWPVR
jgi:hypothetical protein